MKPDPLHLLFLEIGRLQGQIAACQANLHRSTAECEALRERAADLVRQAAELSLPAPSEPARN